MGSPTPSDFEVRTPDWLPAHVAEARILSAVQAPRSERLPVLDAVGRALAEELVATATLPPWDNSAMDGYAVLAEDIVGAQPTNPVTLTVVGAVRAGDASDLEVRPGEAIRIMTGAPVPRGADSVVRVEDTDAESVPGVVQILGDGDRGRNIRPAGEDMNAGDLILRPGACIHPGTVGVLYALGANEVLVARRPVVAILSTGDELRPPERYADVQNGRGIPESNGPMLVAAVEEAGCEARYLGIAADDVGDVRSRLESAGDVDAVITVGGASMGEADLVKRVLDDMGFDLDFWRARVRPGSPISFGHLPRGAARQPVFGLPGNPASSFVTFELFVRPFLRRLAGHDRTHRPRVRCVAGTDLAAPKGLLYALRVRVDTATDPPKALAAGPQGSGLVQSMAAADGLAIIPEEVDSVKAGDPVDVMLLTGGLHSAEHALRGRQA